MSRVHKPRSTLNIYAFIIWIAAIAFAAIWVIP